MNQVFVLDFEVLLFGDEVCYFGRHLLGNRTIETGRPFSDLTFFIDEKGSWNPSDPVILHQFLRGDDDGVGNVHRVDEVSNNPVIPFIHAHSDQLKTVLLMGLIELN